MENGGTWGRILRGLPIGQLSFVLKAASDTLPTPLNLKRWSYRVSAKCPLCDSPAATVSHILNGCPTVLNQGRFTWRHDSVLHVIYNNIKSIVDESCKVYCDLVGLRAFENPPSVIPSHILDNTTNRPNLVIVKDKELSIIKLTIPFNSPSAFDKAHRFKLDKYQPLLSDFTWLQSPLLCSGNRSSRPLHNKSTH